MNHTDRAAFDAALHQARVSAYPLDEYVEQESFMVADEILDMARRSGIGPDVSVLDLCCGVGGPGRHITRTLGCSYLGVDADATAVAIAGSRGDDLGCRFHVAQVPPLPPGRFDVVLLFETLLAFADKQPLITAIADALVPNGRFAFTLEEGAPLTDAERAAMPDSDTVWLTPLDEMRELLERAGFIVVRQADHTAQHRATAGSLANAFASRRTTIAAQIGERAVDDLIVGHRLWVDWLGSGRARKFAFVALRAQR